MKVASWNVNGIRAVARRGFAEWLQKSDIDVLCLQEIKIDQEMLSPDISGVRGYQSYFNHADKKGYSGVAVYSRKKPLLVIEKALPNDRFNREGRSLYLEFNSFSLLNVYMPHGGRDKSKLGYKLEVYEELLDFMGDHKGKPLVIAGDFNVAHHDIDLARPKQNRNNIMFTAEERKQLDRLMAKGFTDSFRFMNKTTRSYTWWPYMAKARERNIGWRIDYIFVPNDLRPKIIDAATMPEVIGSDHCPTMVRFKS